jgi:periplasmic copper chaperone A
MRKSMLARAAFASAVAFSLPVSAHNALDLKEGYAGYSTPMVLSVNHGCKGSPVVGLKIQVPDGITDAKAAFDPNWTIEYKMRKLSTPIEAHGRQVTEVVGEIIWKDPVKVVPADAWYPFQFRMTLPETPGKVLHVKNITVCKDGTDPYIDMPSAELDIKDPEFAKKTWAFMTATSGPAPFLVIRAPARKQYPWEWTPEQAKGTSPKQEAMAK